MTRHHRQKRVTDFEKMAPIDPDEFLTTWNWAMNAATGKALIDNPSNFAFDIEEENGSLSKLRFNDNPFIRMIAAVNERYEHDTNKYFNAMSRIRALRLILQDSALPEWMKEGLETTQTHPAVVRAAAIVGMDKDGYFPIDVFTAKVNELSSDSK